MVRELKLKVWNQYLNQWENCFELRTENKELKAYIEDDVNECEVEAIIVYSTGLKDKNGKEIYDGDIMNYDSNPLGGETINCVVKFEDGSFDLFDGGSIPYCEECRWFWRDCEVIGNIYENQELLK